MSRKVLFSCVSLVSDSVYIYMMYMYNIIRLSDERLSDYQTRILAPWLNICSVRGFLITLSITNDWISVFLKST